MRRAVSVLVLVFLVSAPAAAHPGQARLFELEVNGVMADGWVAYPASKSPDQYDKLIVFAHGINHQIAKPEWRRHLEEAATHGAIAMAMDYSDCFDLDVSRDETIAATKHFRKKHPKITSTYLVSVSMGGAVAGMVLASPQGKNLFDHWVSIEGMLNLIETWAEATAAAPSEKEPAFIAKALACMKADAGESPLAPGNGYHERTAVRHAAAIASSGIKSVVLVHSLLDGIVPYNQSREMAAALIAAAFTNIDFYSVVRGTCRDDTRLYTHVIGNQFDPVCAAGHATETTNSFVMRTGFDALFMMVNGVRTPNGYHECTADRSCLLSP